SSSLKDNIISGLPPCAAITTISSIEEPDNSLSMGGEHLDTIPATESEEFIKSSFENLVLIPNESEGVPDNMCDVPFHDNSPPLDVSKDQFEDFSDSNDESTSYDDDSFSIDNIEYVGASPLDSELVSSEETNTFDYSLLEFETFCFDLEEISTSSTTTHSDISLPEYEAFYDDHVKEISSNSTTTHSDSSLYDSFIFDLSINLFPPVDRSDFYEFADELTHIISPPEYDCFCFKIEPNSGDFTMDVVEDTFPTREPRVHNAFPTHPTLQLNLDFILSRYAFSLFSLTGATRKWWEDESIGSITTWVDLKETIFGKLYKPSRIGRKIEANEDNFDVKWDPNNIECENWLASKFRNHKTIDEYTKNALYSELKEETFINKRIMEESMNVMEESSADEWDHDSPVDEWKDYEHTTYIETDASFNQNTYNNACQIVMDHNETQEKQGWFDEHELMGDDDDDIGDLGDYFIQKDPPYYDNEEEERSKERRCKLLGIPYVKPPTCKLEKFKVVKYSFRPADEYVTIKEYEYDIWVKTKKNVSQVYQDIFQMKDGEWSVTRTK
nr:hypothetical protein [Tanacetum cinerariifolium]